MTSNSFQFDFWILFNYVYSRTKPETINEIEKNSKMQIENNLTSLGENYVNLYVFGEPPPGPFAAAILNLAAILPRPRENGPGDEVGVAFLSARFFNFVETYFNYFSVLPND